MSAASVDGMMRLRAEIADLRAALVELEPTREYVYGIQFDSHRFPMEMDLPDALEFLDDADARRQRERETVPDWEFTDPPTLYRRLIVKWEKVN